MNNIHELKNQFNSFLHECVLVGVEEVGDGAYKDKATQNMLKALITESHMKVERKHIDSFQAQNNCNFVICSNFNSPVEITEDNRRFVVLALNEDEKQNTEYFSKLILEMKNPRVIEKERWLATL